MPIGIIPSILLVGAALDLAMRFNRTVSDSLYLALAMGRGCRIITADRHLYAALRRSPLAPALLWVGMYKAKHIVQEDFIAGTPHDV